jgi:ferric-dicitrate binding protein FerR (iron transport regulator)
MTNTNDIDTLISKVISGNATDDERSQLNAWATKREDNQKIYQDSLKTWHAAETWLAPENIQRDKLNIIATVNQALMLQFQRTKWRSRIYLAAAILAFPIAIAVSVLFHTNFTSSHIDQTVCEVSAPIGHISKCKLPDGTEVWVNSGSKVTYSSSGFAGKTREVQLDGEAFFEVAKNGKMPFYVRTSLIDVKVTGTSFNVKAFSDSNSFETVLSEGSIELEFAGEHDNQTVKLKPDERAIFNAGQKELLVQNVDARIYSAWRNGQIIFQDATLSDLIKELERIYDVKFKLNDPSLGSYRFRGAFSYDNNLIEALEKFKVTAQINYYIENKEVWLSRK